MSAINGKGEGESSVATTFKTEPLRKYLPHSDPGTESQSPSCSCLSPSGLHPPASSPVNLPW